MLQAGVLAGDRVAHAFTTREGGVSEGPYESLNLTLSRGDDAARVAKNRERVRKALGLQALVFARQVHGRTVLRVDSAPENGAGAGEGDALITDRPGLGLVAQTADCTPVLLFDPVRPAVAAVHSGWRGAVQDIAGETVRAMRSAYGSDPQRLFAAIGPAVSKANYRVGPEVLEEFARVFSGLDEGLTGPRDAEGGAVLDVSEAVRRQLVSAGLRPGNIERIPLCTFADQRFFSSRRARGGPFGGQGGVIGLIP
ncbi:MAG: peptidoglycan editing factor PgeF [Maricaulaceae bacterium]|nr:peptidoglycan editing factor PgeF [Maricaulaceae bacterium]